ncbi:hypothetical protein [Mucilaginibacter sp. HD30]
MNRLLKLTFQYYRLLLTYNVVFTLLVIVMAFPASIVSGIGFFFSKLIGYLSAASLQYFLAPKTLFFYRNAGFSAKRVMLSAFIIETVCCILLLILINMALNATTYLKS